MSNVVALPKAKKRSPNLSVALSLADSGIPVFPCDPTNKEPRTFGDWKTFASTDEAEIKKWWRRQPDSIPAFSPGMVGLLVIDCDRHGGPDGVLAWAKLVAEHDWVGAAPVVNTPSGGQHIYLAQRFDQPLGCSAKGLPKGIDVRGVGGYVIAPGAVLADGRAYSPLGADQVVGAPIIPDWLFDKLYVEPKPFDPPGDVTERERAYAKKVLEGCVSELSALEEGERGSRMNAVTYRLGRMGGSGWSEREVVEAAIVAACEDNGLVEKDGERKVRQIFNSGWTAGVGDPHPPLPDTGIPYSEINLALRFAELHANALRYVDDWGRWLWWDGKRWTDAKRQSAFNKAQQLCRKAAEEGLASKQLNIAGAKKIESGQVVGMIEKLARADDRLNIRSEQLDQHDWLLNTPGGIVDLRTGELLPHEPSLLLTKMASVAPDASCPTPVWDAFQSEIADGDEGLVGFKRRWYGYGLTGSTREQRFIFGWGEGGNGKGTEAGAVAGMLAEYHRVVPIMTLVQQRYDSHPTDLAGLAGARLVTASETPEGINWDEVKIKTLTGGDKITARFMRGDFFDFHPKFKLTVHGNNKPGLKSVDEAIRRRVLLVPYAVTIPPERRDPELADKLKAEWPGILHKLVQGCLEWQRDGLAPPEAVTEATKAYLEDQDLLGQFLEERCAIDESGSAQSSELFESWRDYCEQQGQKRMGQQKEFNDQLAKRGFEKMRRGGGFKFLGLKLVVQSSRRSEYEEVDQKVGSRY